MKPRSFRLRVVSSLQSAEVCHRLQRYAPSSSGAALLIVHNAAMRKTCLTPVAFPRQARIRRTSGSHHGDVFVADWRAGSRSPAMMRPQ